MSAGFLSFFFFTHMIMNVPSDASEHAINQAVVFLEDAAKVFIDICRKWL